MSDDQKKVTDERDAFTILNNQRMVYQNRPEVRDARKREKYTKLRNAFLVLVILLAPLLIIGIINMYQNIKNADSYQKTQSFTAAIKICYGQKEDLSINISDACNAALQAADAYIKCRTEPDMILGGDQKICGVESNNKKKL